MDWACSWTTFWTSLTQKYDVFPPFYKCLFWFCWLTGQNSRDLFIVYSPSNFNFLDYWWLCDKRSLCSTLSDRLLINAKIWVIHQISWMTCGHILFIGCLSFSLRLRPKWINFLATAEPHIDLFSCKTPKQLIDIDKNV